MAAPGFDRRYDPVYQRPGAHAGDHGAPDVARTRAREAGRAEAPAGGTASEAASGARAGGGTTGRGTPGREASADAASQLPRSSPSESASLDGAPVNFPTDRGLAALPDGAGNASDDDPGQRRRRNPFLVSLWVLSLALLMAAAWATREVHEGFMGSFFQGGQFGEDPAAQPEMDRFARLQYLPHVVAGLYAAAGAALAATFAVHALRWNAGSGS